MKLISTFLFSLLFVFSQELLAQKKGDKKKDNSSTQFPTVTEESELKKVTTSFVDAYGQLSNNKDKKTILKFMADKVTATLINANINGKVRTINSDKEGLEMFLDKVISTENLVMHYTLKSISRDYVTGNVGLAVYVADYQVEKDGLIWSKGSETVTLAYKKVGEEWKIVHYTTITIEDEKIRGECYCEIFEARPGNIVAKTVIPNGKSYDTNLNNFEISTDPSTKQRSLRLDLVNFHWAEAGTISYEEKSTTTFSGIENKSIGTAKDRDEAILLILKEYLFKEHCSVVKMRKK